MNTPPESEKATSLPAIVPLVVAGALFMENLDATVIVTALPAMARDFDVTAATLSLGISGYMLAVAIFVPIGPWLADRLGTRNVLCAAMLLFTAASLLCGLCDHAGAFVATRIAQGAAAALMSPVGRLVVVRNTPKAALIGAIAILTWPALIAPVLGPAVGGFLTTYASWRWIFFINLPLGLLGAALAWRFVPQQRADAPAPFDLFGFSLLAGSLAGLICGLEWLGAGPDRWVAGGACLLAGLVLGALTIRRIRTAAHPILSLAPIRAPTFSISSLWGGALSRAAIGATPFLLPLLFQAGFGYSAFNAGLVVLAYFAGNLAMKTITSGIIRRWGFRSILMLNGAILALTILAGAAMGPAWPVAVIAGLLFAGGASRSLQFTALNTVAFAEIPKAETGAATTLYSLLQQLSLTMGVALAALMLNASLLGRGGTTMALADFRIAFLGIGALGLLALISYSRLKPHAGSEVSGHGAEPRR